MGVCLPHRWQPGLLAFKTPPSAVVLPPQGSTGYFSSVTLQPSAYLGPHPGPGPWEEKRPPWSQVLIPSAQVLVAVSPHWAPAL